MSSKTTAKRHEFCQVQRIMLVLRGSTDMESGGFVFDRKEWVVGPCNGPLWSPFEKVSGRCASCRAGWSCPETMPAGDA
jgi:hypothetical protein